MLSKLTADLKDEADPLHCWNSAMTTHVQWTDCIPSLQRHYPARLPTFRSTNPGSERGKSQTTWQTRADRFLPSLPSHATAPPGCVADASLGYRCWRERSKSPWPRTHGPAIRSLGIHTNTVAEASASRGFALLITSRRPSGSCVHDPANVCDGLIGVPMLRAVDAHEQCRGGDRFDSPLDQSILHCFANHCSPQHVLITYDAIVRLTLTANAPSPPVPTDVGRSQAFSHPSGAALRPPRIYESTRPY